MAARLVQGILVAAQVAAVLGGQINTNSGVTWTYSGKSTASSSSLGYSLSDGNAAAVSQGWQSPFMVNGDDHWIQAQFTGSPVRVRQIKMRGLSAVEGHCDYPTAFRFQGSNNGATWTNLLTVTAGTDNVYYPHTQCLTYTLSSSANYEYYRVFVTAVGGRDASGLCDTTYANNAFTANGGYASISDLYMTDTVDDWDVLDTVCDGLDANSYGTVLFNMAASNPVSTNTPGGIQISDASDNDYYFSENLGGDAVYVDSCTWCSGSHDKPEVVTFGADLNNALPFPSSIIRADLGQSNNNELNVLAGQDGFTIFAVMYNSKNDWEYDTYTQSFLYDMGLAFNQGFGAYDTQDKTKFYSPTQYGGVNKNARGCKFPQNQGFILTARVQYTDCAQCDSDQNGHYDQQLVRINGHQCSSMDEDYWDSDFSLTQIRDGTTINRAGTWRLETATGELTTSTTAGPFTVGTIATDQDQELNLFIGEVAQLVMYKEPLTNGEMNNIEQNLANLYLNGELENLCCCTCVSASVSGDPHYSCGSEPDAPKFDFDGPSGSVFSYIKDPATGLEVNVKFVEGHLPEPVKESKKLEKQAKENLKQSDEHVTYQEAVSVHDPKSGKTAVVSARNVGKEAAEKFYATTSEGELCEVSECAAKFPDTFGPSGTFLFAAKDIGSCAFHNTARKLGGVTNETSSRFTTLSCKEVRLGVSGLVDMTLTLIPIAWDKSSAAVNYLNLEVNSLTKSQEVDGIVGQCYAKGKINLNNRREFTNSIKGKNPFCKRCTGFRLQEDDMFARTLAGQDRSMVTASLEKDDRHVGADSLDESDFENLAAGAEVTGGHRR